MTQAPARSARNAAQPQQHMPDPHAQTQRHPRSPPCRPSSPLPDNEPLTSMQPSPHVHQGGPGRCPKEGGGWGEGLRVAQWLASTASATVVVVLCRQCAVVCFWQSGSKGAGAGCYGPPWPCAGCAAQGRVLPIPQCPTRLESFGCCCCLLVDHSNNRPLTPVQYPLLLYPSRPP
jgi:hypothetical protein